MTISGSKKPTAALALADGTVFLGRGHGDHSAILDALEARDIEEANRLMMHHIDHIEADLDLRVKEGLALKEALAL